LREHGERIASAGGKSAKKRAVVAVARKLAVLLHHLWKTGEVYDPMYPAGGATELSTAAHPPEPEWAPARAAMGNSSILRHGAWTREPAGSQQGVRKLDGSSPTTDTNMHRIIGRSIKSADGSMTLRGANAASAKSDA